MEVVAPVILIPPVVPRSNISNKGLGVTPLSVKDKVPPSPNKILGVVEVKLMVSPGPISMVPLPTFSFWKKSKSTPILSLH